MQDAASMEMQFGNAEAAEHAQAGAAQPLRCGFGNAGKRHLVGLEGGQVNDGGGAAATPPCNCPICRLIPTGNMSTGSMQHLVGVQGREVDVGGGAAVKGPPILGHIQAGAHPQPRHRLQTLRDRARHFKRKPRQGFEKQV